MRHKRNIFWKTTKFAHRWAQFNQTMLMAPVMRPVVSLTRR